MRDDPHICFVTTRELENPAWEPLFRHGLVAVNLVTHCDEATPGVHFTFIPFSKCTRGPEAQAVLGRALTGMGYPSKWVEVLDEQGNKIPKLDRNGNVIREKDGSIRYKKEAQGQGLIDWIEDQKQWIQNEMLRRYGWERAYKGSHPRGNLSTPDYKAARAQERQKEAEIAMEYAFQCYSDRIYELSALLAYTIGDVGGKSTRREIIDHYLDICPDETFYAIVEEAVDYLNALPAVEHQRATQTLQDLIQNARLKAQPRVLSGEKSKEHTY